MKAFFLSLFLLLSFSVFSNEVKDTTSVFGEVIVRMQKGQTPQHILREFPKEYNLQVKEALVLYSDIWLLTFDENQIEKEKMINLLYQTNKIALAQANHYLQKRATTPNDPNYGNQWHHVNIQSAEAWDITTGGTTPYGTDIVVALMESADLRGHVDLKDNQWVNAAEIAGNGIDDDGNGYVDDYNGWNVATNNDNIGTGSHGTSCAGMIGAKGNNGIGMAGINWDIKIMAVAEGDNPYNEARLIAGYGYPIQQRLIWNQTGGEAGAFVTVTSTSWGIDRGNPNNYPVWCSLYDDLGEVGILSIGATTNNNDNVDVVGDVPSGCSSPYIIGVTATNINDVIDFAGYGPNTIDVAAPGSAIRTTAANNGYTTTSGTSFATPLTAGLVGLMYSIPCENLEIMAKNDPEGTAEIVKQALLVSVDVIPNLQNQVGTGGRINASRALDTLMSWVCNTCTTPSNIEFSSIGENSTEVSYEGIGNSYTIEIREEGGNSWETHSTSNSSIILTNLEPCTTYEVRIQAACEGEDESSNKSPIHTFRTQGCGNCIDLEYCENLNITQPEVLFTVHSPSNIAGNYSYVPTNNFGGELANGYVYSKLVLAEDGSGNNEGCNTFTNATEMNGNIAVIQRGTCDFVLKVKNAQNAGAKAAIIINNTGGAPIEMGGTDNSITIPAVMITQSNGNTLINAIQEGAEPMALIGQQREWIEAFEVNGNNFISGDNNGYYHHSSSLSLARGGVYNFKLTPGFDGDTLPEYTRIWIDLNQDGTFTNDELIFDPSNASLGVVAGNFSIPANALIGSTRMRIQMMYQGYGADALGTACSNFRSGEVEDICIEITEEELSISQEVLEKNIQIYPNPAAETVHLSNGSKEKMDVLVYDVYGQILDNFSLESSISINVINWKSGVYLFSFIDKKNNIFTTKKVVIYK